MLAIIGFNDTAGSVDFSIRLKYSNMSSVTASLRMDTITVCVVVEGLNVRSSDVLEKSIPAVLREKTRHFNLSKIAAYPVRMLESLLSDSPTAVPFTVCKDAMTSLARIPLSKDTVTLTSVPSTSVTE